MQAVFIATTMCKMRRNKSRRGRDVQIVLNPANIINHKVAELPRVLSESNEVKARKLRVGPQSRRVNYPVASSAAEVENACWWCIAIIVK